MYERSIIASGISIFLACLGIMLVLKARSQKVTKIETWWH